MAKKYLDIEVRARTISVYDFDKDVKSIIEDLQGYIKEFGDSVRFDVDPSVFDSVDIVIYYTRKETDDERDRRLAKARKARAKKKKEDAEKEEREKKEYERLRAKFENG